MPDFSFPEYLDVNAGRAYPLSEAGGRWDVTGGVQLPDDLLVDARISVLPTFLAGTFYLSRVELFADRVGLELSYDPGDGSDPRVVAVLRRPVTADFGQSLAFTGGGPDASVTGTLTLGDLGRVVDQLVGSYDFRPDQTAFEGAVLAVGQPEVCAIEIYNAAAFVDRFDDVLRLRAGRNCRFVREDATTVRLDVVDGLNTTDPDACAASLSLGPPIRTINGIAPDAGSNFRLEGSDCIDLVPGAASLQVVDHCSQSCCGCDELAQLVQGLQDTEAQVQQLNGQVALVQQQIQGMLGNLLGGLVQTGSTSTSSN